MPKKIGILTGGGDCPGLNPAIKGCVWAAEKMGFECVGLADGWKGLARGKTLKLNRKITEYFITQGGTYLGTSRTNPYKKEGEVKKCLQNFRRLGLGSLVAMGGEDTLGVAARLYRDYKFPVVGVPKTMDNDLSVTDYTFGFDTASTLAADAAQRLMDTGKSHKRVMVLEVMGRHAGWVALFTAIASAADYVCVPEKKVDVRRMIDKVKKTYTRKKFALVVTSEAAEIMGLGDEEAEKEKDEFGHIILKERGIGEKIASVIQKETGIETRHSVIGHMQRGGAPTLFDRMLGVRVGIKAAQMAKGGEFGKMAALVGNEIKPVPLDKAAGCLKVIDRKWFEIMSILFD